jgi:hypothetical protein
MPGHTNPPLCSCFDSYFPWDEGKLDLGGLRGLHDVLLEWPPAEQILDALAYFRRRSVSYFRDFDPL